MVEQVARNQGDAVGASASVLAQVENYRSAVGERRHRGRGGVAHQPGRRERPEIEIPNVPREAIDLREPVMLSTRILERLGWRWGRGKWKLRQHGGAVADREVAVAAPLSQMRGQHLGERPATGDGVVFAALSALPNGLRHPGRRVREDVVVREFFEHAVDHGVARRRVNRHVGLGRETLNRDANGGEQTQDRDRRYPEIPHQHSAAASIVAGFSCRHRSYFV